MALPPGGQAPEQRMIHRAAPGPQLVLLQPLPLPSSLALLPPPVHTLQTVEQIRCSQPLKDVGLSFAAPRLDEGLEWCADRVGWPSARGRRG